MSTWVNTPEKNISWEHCGQPAYWSGEEVTCSKCQEVMREDEVFCCDAKAPRYIVVARGTAMATCTECSYRNVYWDCACELRHNHKEWL